MARIYSREHPQINYNDDERKKRNKHLVNMIVEGLKGLKYDNTWDVCRVKYKYVLEHTIRQYLIPKDNWHVTKAADELWKEIAEEDISLFSYKETFTVKVTIPKTVITYSGTKKEKSTPVTLENGQRIEFNKVFICEHTTPVADIINELRKLGENITPQSVVGILDRIHITRMLRTEDRSITKSSGRIKETDAYKSNGKDFTKVNSDELFKELVSRFYKNIEILQDSY